MFVCAIAELLLLARYLGVGHFQDEDGVAYFADKGRY